MKYWSAGVLENYAKFKAATEQLWCRVSARKEAQCHDPIVTSPPIRIWKSIRSIGCLEYPKNIAPWRLVFKPFRAIV